MEKVIERYSWKKCADDTLNVYRNLKLNNFFNILRIKFTPYQRI